MRKTSCFNCPYYKQLKKDNGELRNYCADKDCTVDPYEPECNYD